MPSFLFEEPPAGAIEAILERLADFRIQRAKTLPRRLRAAHFLLGRTMTCVFGLTGRGCAHRVGRERFAEIFVDARKLSASGQETDGLADSRRERAVPQVVLEQPTGPDIERAASRNGLDQVLPKAFELRAAAAHAERGKILFVANARALASSGGETHQVPGGPSRWNRGKDNSYVPLRPELVVEVAYDHMEGRRFRHLAQFRRWRPDKLPADCTYDQLEVVPPQELAEMFAAGV